MAIEAHLAPVDFDSLPEAYRRADTGVPLSEHTVGSLLADRARAHPERLALAGTPHGGTIIERLSYAELYERAERVATALLRVTEPGAYVALWAPNVLEWPIIEYGAALAGVVLVAVNPAFQVDELEYVLRHSGATVLLHAESNRGSDMAAAAIEAAARVPECSHIISLADRARWQAEPGAIPIVRGPNATDPDAPVMLQYTSGTTGNPKGVLLRHRSLVNVAKMTMSAAEIESGAVCIGPLPMFHTAACVISTLGPAYIGGTLLLVETFAPRAVLEWAVAEQASVLFFVPTVLGALLDALRGSDLPAPRFRSILGGAATVAPVLIDGARTVFGGTVHNLFGQTELAPVLTMIRRQDSPHDQLTTVGRPIPQVECKIARLADGSVAALGEEGEICARGYQQMIEYLGDPVATAATVDADGWLHTGDLGSMDARGYITLTGRLKDLIISGGENIAPAEVESLLLEHDSVAQVTVVGVPDPKWGEAVSAVVVLRADSPTNPADSLRAHVRDRLATFKQPKRWFVADELPVTASGKVRKFEVVQAISAGRFDEIR
ncbi:MULTISPECIES: class I adenylate-forming enzyme family protein [unclassified Nocardia]|uniref:class I adenylate-forming enzyme family protein n=1 Tax=unclassified Nocardia TaxID=2637762 RepID=UPI0035DC6A90